MNGNLEEQDEPSGKSATSDVHNLTLSNSNFPLSLKFEKLSIGQRIMVHDANGSLILSVLQKPFKLKAEIQFWLGPPDSVNFGTITADNIIDFNGRYQVYSPVSTLRGSINRFGTKSIWKATYSLHSSSCAQYKTICEVNPWIKVADAILTEIPVIGYLHGYVFHPRYKMVDDQAQVLYELEKFPCFFEGYYVIHKHREDDDADLVFHIMSLILVAIFERRRG